LGQPAVTVLPLTSTTTGIVNPLLAAVGAETVMEPVFRPLHNPAGLIVSGKYTGVVAGYAPTVIHGVDVEAVTGIAELSLAMS
jgi:hypothetical protein